MTTKTKQFIERVARREEEEIVEALTRTGRRIVDELRVSLHRVTLTDLAISIKIRYGNQTALQALLEDQEPGN